MTTCPKCKRPQVEGCDGKGNIVIDEYSIRPCVNMRQELIKQILLPVGLWSSIKAVPTSPLFQMTRGQKPTVDRTNENLLIKCSWKRTLRSHLKWTLGCKVLMPFTFLITDDVLAKEVYLGQYIAKGRRENDTRPIYNSLTDLMSEPDLVIFRLGLLGYSNKAAAGILKEALMVRVGKGKPTWVVEDPDYPWSHSRSADVEDFIDRTFEELVIPELDGEVEPDIETNIEVSEVPRRPKPKVVAVKASRPRPPPVEESVEEDETPDLDIKLPSGGKKKTWSPR
jgi:hypothetical protein